MFVCWFDDRLGGGETVVIYKGREALWGTCKLLVGGLPVIDPSMNE